LRAANRDSDLTNPLTTDDLRFIVESEIEQNDGLYEWEEEGPGKKKASKLSLFIFF